MKILVVKAMSNSKQVAEGFITNQLPQVFDNVVKIFLFAASASRKEWKDEISDKHISAIVDCANNVVTKRGHLSKETLERVWSERLEKRVRTFIRAELRNPKYARMARAPIITEQSVSLLIQELLKYRTTFASKVLIDEIETGDSISGDLHNIAVFCSNSSA